MTYLSSDNAGDGGAANSGASGVGSTANGVAGGAAYSGAGGQATGGSVSHAGGLINLFSSTCCCLPTSRMVHSPCTQTTLATAAVRSAVVLTSRVSSLSATCFRSRGRVTHIIATLALLLVYHMCTV
jgi:hypothetical protein